MKWFDEHPVSALLGSWAALSVALVVSDYQWGPILLGEAGGGKRTTMYSQIATMAVAVMAATLTVLSILVAMPDRPRVAHLRKLDGWRLLQGMLLATGAVCLATVIAAELGLSFDTETLPHRRWVEQVCVASVISAAVGTLVSGIAFALVLKAASGDDEGEPTTVRGSDPNFS